MNAWSVLRGVGLVGAALAVESLTADGAGRRLDVDAFTQVNRHRGTAADRFFEGVTELGSIWASVGAAAIVAASGRRRAAARGLAAASITWAGGQALKRVFGRPRPYDADPDGTNLRIARPNGTSWPSSHPAVLISFVTVASSEMRAATPARLALDGLAAAVGASRVYLGVHYPSDVLGGLLLGKGVAAFVSRARR